jgi:hypothetical protein
MRPWTENDSYLNGFRRAAQICAGDGHTVVEPVELARLSLIQARESNKHNDNPFWIGLEDGILSAYGY